MNCPDVRDQLPALLYGDMAPGMMAGLEGHLTTCPDCRRELADLRQVCAALDVVPVPPVQVNLLRLYQDSASRQIQRARLWRWAALAGAVAAALLLLVLGLRLELRLEGQQIVMRWGTAPPEVVPPVPPPLGAVDPGSSAGRDERLQLLSEIIHALADEAQARDKLQQQQLLRIQARLDELQLQDNARWQDARRFVAALLAAQSVKPKKGDLP